MKQLRSVRSFAIFLLIGMSLSSTTIAGEFKFKDQTLTVPEGFKVEQIAGPPLVNRPMEADFDEQGRLFVSDSSGFSGKSEEQYKRKDHRIMRLVDTDGDGVFDKSTVFADGMMFPEGVLCHDGAVYVSAVPVIWKLVDTDDDGVADERTVWHDGKTMTGCANDLHGPYLGPDGWIYWNKGAFAEQSYSRPGQPELKDSAGHLFRRRADGTASDTIMSGGMDNPVGVTFTASGDPIFTCTFFYHPHAGKKDALVHTIYGSVYGKPNGVLDGLTRTGDLMPPMTQLGSAVPCGVTRYESQVFGKEFQDNIFTSHFNLKRVQRHVLKSKGSTYQTEDSDFLVSDNPEFHPTDVFEDADGSLVVINTGGWYRICCPTSQIAKPDVMGGIFRITRTDGKKVSDPRGLKLKWKGQESVGLAKRLGDSRVAVQKRAIADLGKQGEVAVGVLADLLKQSPSEQVRLNAVWALTRIDGDAARASVRFALNDASDTVRQAACHSAGIHQDAAAEKGLMKCLQAKSPHLRRKAATSLGQLRSKNALAGLLDGIGDSTDRLLEHALIYALIEIGDADFLRQAIEQLSTQSTKVAVLKHRAALIALDQMSGGDLQATEVVPLLTSKQPALKQVAAWIIEFHPEWGGELTEYYRQQLAKVDQLGAEERATLQNQIGQSAASESVQKMIAVALTNSVTSDIARQLLLGAASQVSMKRMPATWTEGLVLSLNSTNHAVSQDAVSALKARLAAKGAISALKAPLLTIAGNVKQAKGARLAALSVLSSISRTTPSQKLFDFLISSIEASRPPMERSVAAGVLEHSNLNGEQMQSLALVMKNINPMELSSLLVAFKGCSEEKIGLQLIDSLSQSEAKSALRSDMIDPLLEKFPQVVKEKGEALLASVNVGIKEQKAKLDALEKVVVKGDKKRGHLVYNSQKTACSVCHSIGYVGGKFGPDLTHIGKVRTERDLLEAIIYPSSNFVRSYEPVTLTTKAGGALYGMLREASSDHVALVMGPGAEQRIARADIAEIAPGAVSLMPQGLDAVMSEQDLADLVVFLKSLK
ncbi:MAG: dehydrogenase [Verrucomicrobia bacterium]|nr:dehydrogenase [Verrucomicrobiota bacterium]